MSGFAKGIWTRRTEIDGIFFFFHKTQLKARNILYFIYREIARNNLNYTVLTKFRMI